MHELLSRITRIFNNPKEPKAKHFDSLKELREFQRKNPGYIGPLWFILEDSGSEDK